jgi:hypothetical protein
MESLIYFVAGFFFGTLFRLLREQKKKEVERKNTLKICNPKYNPTENSWTWELKKRV